MHVVGHYFHFNNPVFRPFLVEKHKLLEPFVKAIAQYLAPVLWAENDVVLATEYKMLVSMIRLGMIYDFHASPKLNTKGSFYLC